MNAMNDSNLTLSSNSVAEPVGPEPKIYGQPYEKSSALSFFQQWLRLIIRHKVMIAAIFLLIMPFVTIEAYRQKPLYRASATIEVRRDGELSLRPGETYYYNNFDNTKAEAFMIKSRPVLEKAALSLNLDRDTRFMEVTERRTLGEVLRVLTGGDQKDQPQDKQPAGTTQMALDNDVDNAEKISAIRSNHLTEEQKLKLLPYLGVLGANLDVETFRDMRILRITFVHTDPKTAARVANGIADTFIKHNFETKTSNYNKTSSWLEDSTRKLKSKVEEAEMKLASYSRERNLFTTDGKEDLTVGKLAQMYEKAYNADLESLTKRSRYEAVKNGGVEQLPETYSDPQVTDLRKKLSELSVTGVQMSVKLGAKNPRVVEINEQMAAIRQQIEANRARLEQQFKVEYEQAARLQVDYNKALNSAKAEAVKQNQATIQYAILQQDLATAKSLYTDFLNKTSQANIQLAERYNNVNLIEEADVPRLPFGPRRNSMILLGLALSLGLGFGLAWLIENLNTKVRSADDLARATSLPMLAVIPKLDDASQGAINAFSRQSKDGTEPTVETTDNLFNDFSAAEAYRMLRTSVLLSTADHPPRTILFTSAEPSDGKTTTIINTAITLTQLKAKVLLIDCDMRKPRIHRLAGMEQGDGLSTYLSNGGNIADFIKPSGISNLSILPSGRIPPNPSELISSATMKTMLQLLINDYDYVLIDSPPVATVTDPMILSTLVEGVILVAKSGKTKSELLRRISNDLIGRRAKVLGVVLNDLNVRRDGYGYEYYYYDYKYHYSDKGRKRQVEA